MDIVTKPRDTQLLQDAAGKGCRVVRGSAWDDPPGACTVTERHVWGAESWLTLVGFRGVVEVG